jgi:heme/copper-type cytochrome/quinol oxidase subunit 2
MVMQEYHFGKWFIYAGLGLIAIGLLVWLSGKMGISLGKLPGDIHVQKEKFSLHFPIATSILISIFLTILLNLIFWLFRK